MAIQILKQLETTEQLAVKDLQIALLRAQGKIHEYKQRAEQEFKSVQNDVQKAANALTTKLTSLAKEAKIDTVANLQFEIDKLYFYAEGEAKKVETAVPAAAEAITADVTADAKLAVAKSETAVEKVADKVVEEAKNVVADVEKEIEKL